MRLQKEMSEATRKAALTEKTERRPKERRATDRRKVNIGPPPGMPRSPQGANAGRANGVTGSNR